MIILIKTIQNDDNNTQTHTHSTFSEEGAVEDKEEQEADRGGSQSPGQPEEQHERDWRSRDDPRDGASSLRRIQPEEEVHLRGLTAGRLGRSHRAATRLSRCV